MSNISRLQDQYVGTNIEDFIVRVNQYVDETVGSLINNFYSNVFNLDTATSYGLDVWGKLLNFPRILGKKDDPSNTLTLEDDQYRIILMLIAIQMGKEPTIDNINENVARIFSILNIQSHIVDKQDMTFVTYAFTSAIPQWLYFVFNNYQILPRPMGVNIEITEDIVGWFGFEGQYDENGYNMFNFYHAMFKGDDEMNEFFGLEGQDLGNFRKSYFANNNEVENG